MYKCMLCLSNKYNMIGYHIEKSYRIPFVILFNINILLITTIYNATEAQRKKWYFPEMQNWL